MVKKIFSRRALAYVIGCVILTVILLMTSVPEQLVIHVTNEIHRDIFKSTNEKPLNGKLSVCRNLVCDNRFSVLRKMKAAERSKSRNNTRSIPVTADPKEKCYRRLPKALIVGFPRCGTEALVKFLRFHPSLKVASEIHYFDYNTKRKFEWYRKTMPCSFSNQTTLEKTAKYSWTRVAPKIYKMDKEMRIIFIVRKPVERLISQFIQDQDLPNSTVSLESKIIRHDGTLDLTNDLIRISRYRVHLKRWLYYFDLNQIHVVDGKTFKKDPVEELRRVEHFLNIQPYFTKDHFVFDEDLGFFCLRNGKDPERCASKSPERQSPKLDSVTFKKLNTYFESENAELFNMIGQRFNWKPPL